MKGFYMVNLPNGQVQYRMAYQDPLTNKTKRVSMVMDYHSVRNQRKAEEILSEKVAKLTDLSHDGTLLSEALDDYYKDMSYSWRDSTKERNTATLGRVLRMFPEGTVLQNISAQKWKSILNDISAHGNASTYNEYLKRVKAFLRWSHVNDYLETNIADKLSRKVEDKDADIDSKATDKYLEPSEASALIESMEAFTRYHQFAKFMLLSGLRFGEAAALLDSDVGSKYISVRKTLNERTRLIGPPKTPKSNRDISITEELAILIAEIRRYNKWLKSSLGIKTDIFLFAESGIYVGDYVGYKNFNKFLKYHSKISIKKSISTHWLRHTHASFLLAAGVPIDVISRRLGHESTSITERVYLHVIEKLKERDADVLNGLKLLDESPRIVSLSTEPPRSEAK